MYVFYDYLSEGDCWTGKDGLGSERMKAERKRESTAWREREYMKGEWCVLCMPACEDASSGGNMRGWGTVQRMKNHPLCVYELEKMCHSDPAVCLLLSRRRQVRGCYGYLEKR